MCLRSIINSDNDLSIDEPFEKATKLYLEHQKPLGSVISKFPLQDYLSQAI